MMNNIHYQNIQRLNIQHWMTAGLLKSFIIRWLLLLLTSVTVTKQKLLLLHQLVAFCTLRPVVCVTLSEEWALIR